jgi:basic membrane protein A
MGALALALIWVATADHAQAQGKGKVAQVTDVGALGDKGFNDGVKAGLDKAAAELGMDVVVLQSRRDTDYVPNLSQAAEAGAKVVMAVGFLQTDALFEVAKKYPDTFFGGVDIAFRGKDGKPVHLANVREIQFREQQSSYLLGVLAGLMTEKTTSDKLNAENIIGVVAGIKIPSVDRWIAGYCAGARSVNADVKILLTYTGTFKDPAIAKEAALAQYQQGADMIFEIGGAAGLGAFEAARETNHFVYTTDLDKNRLAPDNILASALKDVTQATYLTVKDVADKSFRGGLAYYDINNGGIGLSSFHALDSIVPQDVKDAIEAAKAGMASGKIVPPETPEEVPCP